MSFFLSLPQSILPTGVYWKTCFGDLVSSIRSSCFLQFFSVRLDFFHDWCHCKFRMILDLTLSFRITLSFFPMNFIFAVAVLLSSDFFQCPSLASVCYYRYCKCIVHLQSSFRHQIITPENSIDQTSDSEELCDLATFIHIS